MRYLSTVVLFSVVLVSAGCASKKPPVYNTEDSKALNIVKAAGMDYGLKDVVVPKDTVSDIRHSVGYGAVYGLAGYSAPVPGLSSLSTAGLNIISWALQPKSPAARNSVIAWMPEDISSNKEDASQKLIELIIDATEKAGRELGYEPILDTNVRKNNATVMVMRLPQVNPDCCNFTENDTAPVPAYCNIAYAAYNPRKIDNTAYFLGGGSTWFFDPAAKSFTVISLYSKKIARMMGGSYNNYNQLELLISTSKHLPEWVYFYLAPGEVKISEEEKIKAPMIVNQGEIHYFIKAMEK